MITAPHTILSDDPRSAARAGRGMWFALIFFFTTLVVGLSWDRSWHTTHPFESFYSPPHLFIYATAIISTLLVARLVLVPELRRPFGQTIRLRLFATPVPGALVLAGGGLLMLGFAGLVLDNAWHTRFGLDETGWSTPHAMIGCALSVVALGFVACRLALRPALPLRWYTAVALCWIVLAFSSPFFGPLRENTTPARLEAQRRAVATFPALADSVPFTHVLRIEAAANLTRTNPVYLLLGGLWVGIVLAIVRRLDRRWWVWIGAVALWSFIELLDHRRAAVRLDHFLPISRDAAVWLPPPILPAALVLLLLTRLRLSERWSWLPWLAAGSIFAVLTCATWGRGGAMWLLLPVAAVLTVGGAWLGGRVADVLESPTSGGVFRLIAAIAVAIPLLTGTADLWLRHSIS